jgi:hypothetical protein
MKITVTGGLRFIACPSCGDLHERDKWPANHARPGDPDAIVAPNVIRDELPTARQSQVTGTWHDSKRGIRATYQPSGNPEGRLYQEIGNEKQPPFKRKQASAKEIRTSMAKAQAKLDRGEVSKETYERKVITRPGPVIARKGKEKAI